MQASGLSQFVDVKDYFRFEAGYYLLVAGALILLGASVYYLVRFFINRD